MTKPRPRPHVLICVGSEEFSEDTIRFGARAAEARDADVSVLYVGLETTRSLRPEVGLARTKLREWELDLPGVRVMRFARAIRQCLRPHRQERSPRVLRPSAPGG